MRSQHFYSTTTFKINELKSPCAAHPQNGEYFNGMVIATLTITIIYVKMSNQKQFGVWMDTQTAVIVGKEQPEAESVIILASVTGEKASSNSSEKTSHNL
ncbi:MAG: hypothetical protein H7254_09255, partial [Ferruginibacter sp.]|nr:hypothetical protein [Ferruginibacter sp.]